MNVSKIEVLDFYTLYKIMSSNQISETQKAKFINQNQTNIKQILANTNISAPEFVRIMQNRPIIKFHPLKNSFTKRGDKILLSKTIGIKPENINDYIQEVTENLENIEQLDFLDKDKLESIKTYVYRHGSKKQLAAFLNYELTKTQDILKILYRTLEYNTGGIADYFVRPIHKFDNKTLVKIYNIIDKRLNNAKESGHISEENYNKTALWALIRIYQIQNNNKLKNALKMKEIID